MAVAVPGRWADRPELRDRFDRAWRSRPACALLAALGGALMLSAGTVALPGGEQAVVGVVTMGLFLVVNRSRSRRATLFLMVLSILVSLRYIVWRLTETLQFNTWLQATLGSILGVAELYAIAMLLLGYFQTAWPLNRKPLPLPPDPDDWPAVDVYVPTYNEDLEIVRSTVLAALAIDWPRDKLNVYILDDGRRVAFRDFAEACGCGYIIRPDNHHAKAGNLNHALHLTDGRFIAVFDCDHIPTRAFLQMTMGWMVADPKLALLQTPHHFYSPDPFQRNLAAGLRVPAEGNMFYGLVQDGNDFWNATFFCGSCAVIRRKALAAVGGFATETVTEDAHTALKLQRRGWSTAYLRLPLAAGLATERLMLHIGQRVRWARGMLQIMRLDNPLFGPGLSAAQRLCYLAAMMHFLFAVPRVVFLMSPMAFLLFGENIIAASPLAITAYGLPHIFHSIATGSRLQRTWRHSFWSEIYETVLALFLVRVTIVTLLTPRRGRFNVTDKGGLLEDGYLDLRATYPNLVLAGLLGIGLLRGILGMALDHGDAIRFQAFALNSVWASFSLVTVLGALAVGRETRQLRRRHRISVTLPVSMMAADGRMFHAVTEDLSLSGARLRIDWPEGFGDEPVQVSTVFDPGGGIVVIPGEARRYGADRAVLRWRVETVAQEADVVRAVFGRADAWVNWNNYPADRPLRGLWSVLISIRALFRRRGRGLGRSRSQPSRTPPEPRRQPDCLGRQTLLLHPKGAVTLALLLTTAAGLAALSGNPARARTIPPLPAVQLPPPDVIPADPPLPSTGTGTGTADVGSVPPPAATGAASPDAAPVGTVASYSLAQLGAVGPMTMRGVSPIQGLQFGVPADSVVTGARLVLSGAMSPSLIRELSTVTVTMNEQYVGTLRVDPQRPTFAGISLPIDPVFIGGDNRLNFRFSGQYTRACNDPLSGLLWATISDQSRLELTTVPIPPRRVLSRLPLPFFDEHVRFKLIVPVVLPRQPSGEVLQAAAVVASWFGRLGDYRGVAFPVANTVPATGNAVAIGLPEQLPQGLLAAPLQGPTLAEIANPGDPDGTVLVVTGRTGTEVEAAAKALALGTNTLGAVPTALVSAPDAAPRRPFDAPAFIRTDRPVRFGELVPVATLEGNGYVPGTMSVPFRTAPDLYTWRSRPFSIGLRYRAPPGPIIDVAASRIDVGINGMYLRSYSLAPPQTPLSWLQKLVGTDLGGTSRGAALPPWMVFGENQLQFYVDARPMHRGDCAAVPGDIHTAIDADSTLDLTRAYHFTAMPNLAFFAGAGFPFTRLADLSGTAMVLPSRAGTVTLSAFLDLMGFFGATTWYPATGLRVLTPDRAAEAGGRDLLLMGTLSELGDVGGVLSRSPYAATGDGRLSIRERGVLDGIWTLFGDSDLREKRQPELSGLDSDLSTGGALIGAESPFASHRSVVAFLGGTPQGLDRLVQALHGKTEQPAIQGDLVLLDGHRLSAYRDGPRYTVGTLPFWLWPDWFLRDRPVGVLLLAVFGCGLVGLVLYRLLEARGRRRNRQLEEQTRSLRRRQRERQP